MIEFITKPDVTGLGRIVVDGKFYGAPIVALEKFVEAEAAVERKDVAIAELVGVLKLSISIIGHPDDAHSKLINDVITKYDNS